MDKQWQSALLGEMQKPYFVALMDYVNERRAAVNVFPPAPDVFNAFSLAPLDQLKVVILGQDPYHGYGQAHGLCFSVQIGAKIPPSLRNIFKELSRDIPNFEIPQHGHLGAWAEQGVLLMNTVLTVEEGKAHSHKGKGWEVFTDSVISYISNNCKGLVFILWGKPAEHKSALIDSDKHCILTSAHPSPLSAHRGFLGCSHFSLSNKYLAAQGKPEIDWSL